MFSALKKLVGSEPAPGRDKHIPAGLQSMNQALQRRFAKGVQYNMKIVIRGDRNTGKTALWHRLQGQAFVEEYIPTQEIRVTSIHWSYKTTDDIVKVEVWDVVDKGKSKKRSDGLKMENDPQEAESEMALDAEFLDVYKNCNGVVMMFDITKQWTFSYIMRELPKVPPHVPVCVLGNYRDMGAHRVILPDDVRHFIDSLDRPPGASYFRYAESSMKNSFGLKYLHKFFNIPFLQLQRETLLRQLETNQLDVDATLEELSVQQETEEQNYDIFLEMMEARSRGHAAPLTANGQSPSSGALSPVAAPSAAATTSSSPSTPQPAPAMPLQAPAAAPAPPPPSEAPAPPARRGIIARLFGTSSSAAEAAPLPPEPALATEPPAKVQNVEDFIPEDGLDHHFLEDTGPPKDRPAGAAAADSDSDEAAPGGNPMVAGFQDDVDLEDQPCSEPPLPVGPVPSQEEAPEALRPAVLAPQRSSEPETKRAPMKASRPPRVTAPRTTGPPVEGPDEPAVSSESDPEGPIAAQMLSFVMDDPDFESDSEAQRSVGEFPVREDPSDVSDEDPEDSHPAQPPPPPKPPGPTFRPKSSSDLFGLGLEAAAPKESSEEDKEGRAPPREEKRKKKKKDREEEEKTTKKKSKHKKDKDKDKDERRRRRPRSQKTALDELEAFLGGGAAASQLRGGGDYEEL
ncbi:rab-like protein 6 isoform X2 [Sorex araneus]|uniref:rab-like protein 6 isoform X2 n=1 Tax=Sorex araneus TaxID=42254 RepID=UPI002433B499|nr:rab-like protein 6 isoform X2 [Sorex araneus]